MQTYFPWWDSRRRGGALGMSISTSMSNNLRFAYVLCLRYVHASHIISTTDRDRDRQTRYLFSFSFSYLCDRQTRYSFWHLGEVAICKFLHRNSASTLRKVANARNSWKCTKKLRMNKKSVACHLSHMQTNSPTIIPLALIGFHV
jgi:hypothetical protein